MRVSPEIFAANEKLIVPLAVLVMVIHFWFDVAVQAVLAGITCTVSESAPAFRPSLRLVLLNNRYAWINFLTALLLVSAMYKLPCESMATPCGAFRPVVTSVMSPDAFHCLIALSPVSAM